MIPLECIFCKIVSREIPANIIYEDTYVCAFYDINPVAPVHIVVIPREHYARLDSPGVEATTAQLFAAIGKIAFASGLSEDGFRVVVNVGSDGGQTVEHLHFHLLGGRQLKWPPG